MTKPSGLPLKIGFVLDGGLEEPDGVQQYILNLGEYYKSLGHSVRYLVSGSVNYGKEDAVSLSASFGVRSNGNRLKVPVPVLRRHILKEYMESEEFDVLHVQTPYIPFLGEQLIFMASPRTVIIGTYHVVPKYWFLGLGNWLLGKWCYFSLGKFDRVVSVSRAAQRIAKRDFGLMTEVLPNVIDFKRYKKAAALDKESDCLTILFLGRLVQRKGSLELLKAVSLLAQRKNVPKFKVVICGKGPLFHRLQAYVAKQGLEDIVEFEGFVPEELKPRYYASADISVFPALGGESFGVVLLEAMASGKSAVLASDNEGYSSVLANYPDQLFKKHDIAHLADKIEELLKDPAKRRSYSRRGSLYTSEFDVKVVGDKLLKIYSEALLKKRG